MASTADQQAAARHSFWLGLLLLLGFILVVAALLLIVIRMPYKPLGVIPSGIQTGYTAPISSEYFFSPI